MHADASRCGFVVPHYARAKWATIARACQARSVDDGGGVAGGEQVPSTTLLREDRVYRTEYTMWWELLFDNPRWPAFGSGVQER